MNDRDSEARDRQRVWTLLGAVEEHAQVQVWLKEAENPGEADREPGLTSPQASAHKRPTRLSRRIPWAMAATLIATLGIAFGIYRYFSTPHFETRIGEQRDVLLPDGSRMTLNTDTVVAVHYSDRHRYIELKHGEALFAVKRDANRPFDVAAGETLTRALGTEFNVDLRAAGVTVSVLEGAVRVGSLKDGSNANGKTGSAAETNGEPIPPTALAAGQALEFRSKERRVRGETANLKRIQAWRTRRLEFSDTPLAEALEEFNRYSTTRVTIGTPELNAVRISGVFRIGDTDGFLFSLQDVLNVQAYPSPNEVVLMRPGA